MRFLSERGLSVRDAWTLRAYLVTRVGQRVLRPDRKTYGSRPRFRNFFPNLGLIFVHVPKTAGTSIQSYFSQLDELVEAKPDRAGKDAEAGKCDPPSKHFKAPELRQHLGEEF